MSAQKVATGVGLTALTALLLSVGLPAALAPESVPAIQINPIGETGDDAGAAPAGGDDDSDASSDDDGPDDDDGPRRRR
jgi:hypothetical protein